MVPANVDRVLGPEDSPEGKPLPAHGPSEPLRDLGDDRWREFENKTRHEWKLSFSIWGALLAASAGLLSGKASSIDPAMRLTAVLIGALAVTALWGLHAWFLWWIQTRVLMIRRDMWEIYKRRWNIVLSPPKDGPCTRRCINQPSMWVQLGITALLGGALIAAILIAGRPNDGLLKPAAGASVSQVSFNQKAK